MTKPITMAAEDAVELAEILEFLHDWTSAHADALATALYEFTAGGLPLEELRADLARFAFLLGGDHTRLFESADE